LNVLAWTLILTPVLLVLYSYVGYPLLLRIMARRAAPRVAAEPDVWPMISITVPVYNEESQIRGLIESLLALDYPADRRQILIVSDASTDRTDQIVAEFADRGIEFLRMPVRGGKTAAENAAGNLLRGEIVINTDASIRIHPRAIKPLIARFADPTVGAASGRDVSVSGSISDTNVGEAGYVGYEMGIRALETRIAGIVGASGCFYAIRSELHAHPLPDALSRDFAAALITRQHGLRTVSVDESLCFVPRTESFQREYRRKVRTIMRGMETLAHLRFMLNPRSYGVFSWMLISHKICRWLVPWAALAGMVGLAILAASNTWALVLLLVMIASMLAGVAAWFLDRKHALPRWLALPAFAWAGNLAAFHAAIKAIAGDTNPTWEPTRRDAIDTSLPRGM
jgi:cellulose synthase/poly-beta-1,6-N-acetylglucosamine synthase-like glycosyltransferase